MPFSSKEAKRDLNSIPLPELYANLSSGGLVRRLLELARDEDLGVESQSGDITTVACGDMQNPVDVSVVSRSPGVIAGLEAIRDVIAAFTDTRTAGDTSIRVLEKGARDGERIAANTTLATLRGPLGSILAVERTLLNLVSRLSGVATKTAEFVEAIPRGSKARLFDTRKTTPGLRVLEKYAVRCGGGMCHRIGLHDAVLIKDNHIAGVDSGKLGEFIQAASARARRSFNPSFVEVEVDTESQLRELLALPRGLVDFILLDNMSPARLRACAEMRDALNPSLQLEASGGITLDTIAEVAMTGVDRISCGSVTHSAVSLDLGLDIFQPLK